ncbi:terpenoid synthase [Wolfiporia cocos MD-104 SS10]|uniref:Terpenoid synthase n=1 Tax=Wolfiporia cocos (strain MD-104) TaxID=742152 RepID=A0A2H3JCH0_WOLCO|nr:terpenoid synthase [Wolfiporia cocos MD-104 SS10]
MSAPAICCNDKTNYQESVSAVSRTIINEFLSRMKYSYPDRPRDYELEARVKDITRSWKDEAALRRHIITGISITETSYSHLPAVDAKVAIAVLTGIVTSIDDPTASAATNFSQRLCNGSIREDPGILGHLAKILANMWDLYPRYSAGLILTSTLDLLNGEMLGEDACGGLARTIPFVEYHRGLTGMPGAYACFIWEKTRFPDERVYAQAIPTATVYINFANDILSFYKEALAGETTTYIYNRARVAGKAQLETLREVVDETVAAYEKTCAILGEGDAKDAWVSFAEGYIQFHLLSPRYRLQELLDIDYLLDETTY